MASHSSVKYYWLLYLISPVMAFYATLRKPNNSTKKWLLILAVTIFGSILRLSGTSDGTRFQQWVYDHYQNKSINRFFEELYYILSFNPLPGTKGDVYIHFISYFAGSVINLPSLFFTMVGFVFGYFHISGIFRILNYVDSTYGIGSFSTWKPLIKLACIVFITVLTVDMMQSIRTWTGAWVLFNGVVGYHQTNKFKYTLLTASACLFHVAFFVMVLPSIISFLMRKVNPKIIIVFYVSSLFINYIPNVVKQRISQTEIGAARLETYQVFDESGNRILETGNKIKNGNFYAKYGKGPAPTLGTNALIFSIILLGLFSRKNLTNLEYGLLLTGIVNATFSGFSGAIPQLAGRMFVVSQILITAVSFITIVKTVKLNISLYYSLKFRILFTISYIIFLPKLIFVAANFIQYASIFILFIPVIGLILKDMNLSIREFLALFGI